MAGGERATNPRDESVALVRAAAAGAEEKLGESIVALDVADMLSVVDFFVVTSGRNGRQVASIVEEVEAFVKAATGRAPLRIEGLREASWVLMDYGDVVVHVFLDETREYYDLEHLWSGAPRLDLSDVLAMQGAAETD